MGGRGRLKRQEAEGKHRPIVTNDWGYYWQSGNHNVITAGQKQWLQYCNITTTDRDGCVRHYRLGRIIPRPCRKDAVPETQRRHRTAPGVGAGKRRKGWRLSQLMGQLGEGACAAADETRHWCWRRLGDRDRDRDWQ